MAKVIGISNFNLESVSDTLIHENMNEEIAKKEVELLNSKCHDFSTYYYKVVPDDYVLYDHTTLY